MNTNGALPAATAEKTGARMALLDAGLLAGDRVEFYSD